MREYNTIDFNIINEWAIQSGFELDKELLSPFGYIDNNIYCSVYLSVGANQMFIDNLITNPESNPIEIKNSLQDLRQTITDMIRDLDGLWCVRITAVAPLAGILEKLGGIVDPEPYCQVFFIV
jgi:hypothetical protein